MTNKEQIIIDGVNVKDCRRRIGKDNYCRYFKRLCSDNNFNCVWKQLARKTQELKQYKASKQASYETMQREWNKATLENRKLKHECGELKREIDLYKTWYRAKHDDIKNLLRSYRKALEEIEEIVKSLNENRMCFYDDINDCSNCDMNTDCNYLRKSKILDIINKAKGEENVK